ncbi:electron transport complex subunit RsxC [Maribrevibacterium harenarium]|uniref:Ion-translocating oxidoreductase complex subunit C n=1 Tax=Maribrevibacterium harenarium TaxID=2589817 RepID=A0A501WX90_9GAMM|nr:electron transport complex subunit RsxC [Maribrevibacterium harenarium]TPE51571.1 electron transport complex subunit RsxC [Maribrevibacterium harenarium]
MSAATVYNFHGGIHPPENKAQSLRLPLGHPKLPEELILPLGQHIGQASRPLVAVGDKVLKGQTIAINNGFLSSFLHAPTSGTVKVIEERPIAHPSGLADVCIVITPDGADEWQELEPLRDWQKVSKTDLLAFLAEKGIVGMGGAGFPTQVKLQGAQKHNLSHLIINAAECEPYITADDMLMREKSLELILGIEIVQHLANAQQVMIGIEDNKPTAIAALEKVIRERQSNIQLVVVPTKYPSGGEKQLIKLLTDQEVPTGKLPADIGILCQNVGTCVAIYEAVQFGRPLISRFTTLTGDGFGAPQNVEVLLGTPVSHLLSYADANLSQVERIVMGGPMMGFTLDSLSAPIVKTSNCILAATRKELPLPEPEQACIRCGMCEQACPASLLPQQLLWFAKSQEHEKAEHYNLFDCIECGACSYVCPSSIPLVQYYRHTKAAIRDAREAAVKSDIAKQRFEARKARQEAEAAEKEAKRLERQKAAAAKPAAKKAAPTKVTEAPAASSAPVDEETKKLKVDLAIAKAKLKKLDKALQEAQERQAVEEISALQLQVDGATADIKEMEAKLPATAPVAKPKDAAPKVALSDEAKKAKVDVALASTKLKKIEKQLADDPDNAELRDKQSALQQELATAEARFAKLQPEQASSEAKPAAAKPVLSDDHKKAKVDVALASTKLKKVEKQLGEDPDNAELKAKQAEFQAALATAQAELAKFEAHAPVTAKPEAKATAPADDEALRKLKIDTAIAKAALKKAEKALAHAQEIGADNVDTLSQQVDEARGRAEALEQALTKGEVPPPAAAPKAEVNQLAEQIKQQKIAAALAKAQVNKLKKQLAQQPEAEDLQQQLSVAEAKQQEEEAKLEQLTNSQENR